MYACVCVCVCACVCACVCVRVGVGVLSTVDPDRMVRLAFERSILAK